MLKLKLKNNVDLEVYPIRMYNTKGLAHKTREKSLQLKQNMQFREFNDRSDKTSKKCKL